MHSAPENHEARGPAKCPKCGLISPREAVVCDCGYDFQAKSVTALRDQGASKRDSGRGLALALLALALGAAGVVVYLYHAVQLFPYGFAGPRSELHSFAARLSIGPILGAAAVVVAVLARSTPRRKGSGILSAIAALMGLFAFVAGLLLLASLLR